MEIIYFPTNVVLLLLIDGNNYFKIEFYYRYAIDLSTPNSFQTFKDIIIFYYQNYLRAILCIFCSTICE